MRGAPGAIAKRLAARAERRVPAARAAALVPAERRLPAVLALAALALCLAAAAPAAGAAPPERPFLVGLGDQKPSTFRDPRIAPLQIDRARLVVPWDAIFRAPETVDTWLREARAAGMTPLVSLGRGIDDKCPQSPCRAPAVSEVAAAFDALRAAHPWMTEFGVWNEANHESQPTAHRPGLAAQYYNALRARCPACTIVAADVLGDRTMLDWLLDFKAALTTPATLWGLHNWTDVTDGETTSTDTLLNLVDGEVWLTETGGVVRFTGGDGTHRRPYDEQRAARAVRFAWDSAAQRAARIRRVYFYNWRAGEWELFDAGLVNFDGSARPSLHALAELLRVDAPSVLPTPNADREPPVPEVVVGTAHVPRAAASAALSSRGLWEGRRVRVGVRCAAAQACTGALTLAHVAGRRVRPLGTVVVALRAGSARRVAVPLDAAARSLLRRSKRRIVRGELALRLENGALGRTRAAIRLSTARTPASRRRSRRAAGRKAAPAPARRRGPARAG